MSKFCQVHIEGVRDEYDGRTYIFSQTSDYTNEEGDLHQPK